MKYTDALKLHIGDEVKTKYTGKIITVLEVTHDEPHKEVYLYCNDGETYLHRSVK